MVDRVRLSSSLFSIMALSVLVASNVVAADVKGSADHPLLPRYENSEIVRYNTEAFNDYALVVAPIKTMGGKSKNADAIQSVEGKLTRISYRAPAGRSALEVFRNYQNALKTAGFEPVFVCEKDACGGRYFNLAVSGDDLYGLFGDHVPEQRYFAGKLTRPSGDVYASFYTVFSKAAGGPNKDRAMIQLDVLETKPMEQKMVVLEASAMERDIGQKGRAAVYGLLFDFDKDAMRPDSKPQLEEIAKLLKKAPALNVLIVGHTDGKGRIDYNRDLSERRARSIADALAKDYGIARSRLTPQGVGMAAPVASNKDESGRALNRRVELVEITN